MQSISRSVSNTTIKVIGIGGGGCNTINHMIEKNLQDVEFIAVDTDPQTLSQTKTANRVCIGEKTHLGLDGSGNPGRGEQAAEYSLHELSNVVQGADVIFIVSTLGGGTGTGAAPVVARIAKKTGALTLGIVTRPFMFEGKRRNRQATEGINHLSKFTDTSIVINDNHLLIQIDRHSTLSEAFKHVDDTILHSVKSISDLLTIPDIICLGLADIRTALSGDRLAQITAGKASGEDRACVAVEKALLSPINFPLIEARSILVNITCSPDLALIEVSQAIAIIRESIPSNMDILFGTLIDANLEDEIQITIITNGYDRLGETKPNYNFANLDI